MWQLRILYVQAVPAAYAAGLLYERKLAILLPVGHSLVLRITETPPRHDGREVSRIVMFDVGPVPERDGWTGRMPGKTNRGYWAVRVPYSLAHSEMPLTT